MASSKDKLQNFDEKLNTLKSILYSLGVNHINNISITSKNAGDETRNQSNLKKDV